MGTIFDQPNRSTFNDDEPFSIGLFVKKLEIIKAKSKTKLTNSEAIEILKIYEYHRRTLVMIEDGDNHDEHMGGLAVLIDSALHMLGNFLDHKSN